MVDQPEKSICLSLPHLHFLLVKSMSYNEVYKTITISIAQALMQCVDAAKVIGAFFQMKD